MAARKRKTRPTARKSATSSARKRTATAPPKRYVGSSRVGIEEAIDAAVHKAPRAFKAGDRITVVKIQATLRHSSPWHITNYSVTIQKGGG